MSSQEDGTGKKKYDFKGRSDNSSPSGPHEVACVTTPCLQFLRVEAKDSKV